MCILWCACFSTMHSRRILCTEHHLVEGKLQHCTLLTQPGNHNLVCLHDTMAMARMLAEGMDRCLNLSSQALVGLLRPHTLHRLLRPHNMHRLLQPRHMQQLLRPLNMNCLAYMLQRQTSPCKKKVRRCWNCGKHTHTSRLA